MAHIGVTIVLDMIGRGETFRCTKGQIQVRIGEQIEHQAFIAYMEEKDPKYFELLQKYYLNDPVRRYDKKIYGMRFALEKSEEMTWDFMSNESLIRVGSLVLRAIMSIPADEISSEGFFEIKKLNLSAKFEKDYLMFSKTGLLYRDLLQQMSDENVFKPFPMVCPPNPWGLDQRGGYLMPPPKQQARLIHGCQKTVPSETALAALNRLQAEPYRINKFIYQVQEHLMKAAHEIGSFRSYEADTWKAEHFPVYSNEYIASLEKGGKEYKKVMRELTDAYHRQKLDEKDATQPRQIHHMAKSVLDETFWTPWYFDGRLRMYPACQLSVTGGDHVKALLVTANPKPITAESMNELLIAIATSGGFDKVDKKDYATRLKWAKEFVKTGEFLDVVLNAHHNKYWREADEPFQFLSYCEEFYSVFVKGYRDTIRVFVGRDMTCSGIQILSSVIGDEKAMTFTNVIPSETPQDAYGEVARVARDLLSTKAWVSVKIDQREDKRVKWNKKNPDEPREPRMIIEIEIQTIERGIVKTQVMTTGYGSTYQTKRDNIVEALKEKGIRLHPDDIGILVAACIEGMEIAFPKYTELNNWFKQVASAAVKAGRKDLRWTSPNGSLIVQEYNEPSWKDVKTYAAAGGHYWQLMTDDSGYTAIIKGHKGPKLTKHQSAIAANFTHTLDACMIQDGLVNLSGTHNCVTVHDCFYSQPGYMEEIAPYFRKAFHNVVSTPVLEDLIELNELDETMEIIDREEVDLTVSLESLYLFS
jgi:DNA-directed RNA polymerase